MRLRILAKCVWLTSCIILLTAGLVMGFDVPGGFPPGGPDGTDGYGGGFPGGYHPGETFRDRFKDMISKHPLTNASLVKSGQFDMAEAEHLKETFGMSGLEHLMEKERESIGTCTADQMSEGKFCLCMASRSLTSETCRALTATTIIDLLIADKCPIMLIMASRRKDNCIIQKLDDHFQSLSAAQLVNTWSDLRVYQKGLLKFVERRLNNVDLTQNVTNSLAKFLNSTMFQLRRKPAIKKFIKKHLGMMQDVPKEFSTFMGKEELKTRMETAGSEEQKSTAFGILRERRRERLESDEGDVDMLFSFGEEEHKLKRANLEEVIACEYVDEAPSSAVDADEMATLMDCSLYRIPNTLVSFCAPIAQRLTDEERQDLLDKRGLTCFLYELCKDTDTPIPINKDLVKCPGADLSTELNATNSLPELMDLIAKVTDYLEVPEKNAKAIAEKLMPFIQSLTPEQAEEAAGVIKHIPMNTLETAPYLNSADKKMAFCRSMGNIEQSDTDIAEVRAKAEFCKTPSDSFQGLPVEEQFQLTQGLEVGDIQSKAADFFKENPAVLQFTCNLDVFQTVATKLQAVDGEHFTNMDPVTFLGMIRVVVGLPEPTACYKIYFEHRAAIMEALRNINQTCQGPRGDAIRTAAGRVRTVVATHCDTALTAQDGARRKRGAGDMTCNDVNSGSVLDRTAGFFSELDCSVFMGVDSCLSTLSDVDGYSFKQQLQPLAEKLIQCVALDQWTESFKASLCIIALGITNAAYKIALTSANDVACIGSKTNTQLTSDELAPHYQKYLSDNSIARVNALTEEHIAEMGFLLCGIPADTIRMFPESVYNKMSSAINAYKCFSLAQLEAWYLRAQAMIGDPITASAVSQLSYVAVGIGIEEYRTFSDQHVRNLFPGVFSIIPTDKLNAIPVLSLCAISAEQANQIPGDVLTAQGEDQIAVFTGIKNGQVPTQCQTAHTDGSGSGSGDSSGSGSGSGDNMGSGDSNGSGSGDNMGSGSGDSAGSGSGSGDKMGSGSGDSAGSGSGSGDNMGSGSGDSNGSGSGSGDNKGSGSGSGDNMGSGSGDSNGSGSGDNMGSGSGDSNGSGAGSGDNMGSGSGSGDNMGSGDHAGSGSGNNMGSGSGSGGNLGSGFGSGNSSRINKDTIPTSFAKVPELTVEDAEKLTRSFVNRLSKATINAIDESLFKKVAVLICSNLQSNQDVKAKIKRRIKDMALTQEEMKSFIGCLSIAKIRDLSAKELLGLTKDNRLDVLSRQTRLIAEKIIDALKASLSTKRRRRQTDTAPTTAEIMSQLSNNDIVGLIRGKLFEEAVNSIKSDHKPVLKTLMANFPRGDHTKQNAKILARIVSEDVVIQDKTTEKQREIIDADPKMACSANDEIAHVNEERGHIYYTMEKCSWTRERMTEVLDPTANLKKLVTKNDLVSRSWQSALRGLARYDDIPEYVMKYFMPFMLNDYKNMTTSELCSSDMKYSKVLEYPQTALGSYIYQTCKDTFIADPAKLKGIAIHASVPDIKRMKAEHILTMAPALPLVSRSKFLAFCEQLNTAFSPDNSASFEKCKPCLVTLPMEKLNAIKEDDRGKFCDMMVCNKITQLSEKEIEPQLTYCMKYLTVENFGCVESTKTRNQFFVASSALATSSLRTNGTTCQMVDNNLAQLATLVVNCDTRKWLYDCAIENGRSLKGGDEDNVELFGLLLDKLTDDEYNKIENSEVECELWNTFNAESQRRAPLIAARSQLNAVSSSCYGMENEMVKKRLSASGDNIKTSCNTASARRRRATTGMTCQEFVSYGGNRQYVVSADDISGMSDAEFKECTEEIGTTPGFQAILWEAAAEKAITSFGPVSTWDSSLLIKLGGITSGLTAQNVKDLNLSGLDAASVVGYTGDWTKEGLTLAFAEFKSDHLLGDMSGITATTMGAIDELNCGASTDDIRNIPPKEYCDAAEKIGYLKHCEPSQMQQYAKLAKHPDCFGDDISSWNPDSIKLLGNQLGGLSADDVGKLSEEHIAEMDREVIQEFPPSLMNAFSAEQLGSFAPELASAITADQILALDLAKRIVVEYRKALYDGEDPTAQPENGAELLEASLMVVLTTVMAALMRI